MWYIFTEKLHTMEQIFASIQISELEDRLRIIVRDEVKSALESKEPVKYYTIREAAIRTGKALSTLYTDHSNGNLKGFKSGRQVRFTEEQLTAYLEGVGRIPKTQKSLKDGKL